MERALSFNEWEAEYKPVEINDERFISKFVEEDYINYSLNSIIKEKEEIINNMGWEGAQTYFRFRQLEHSEDNLIHEKEKAELINNQLGRYMTLSIESYPRNHVYKFSYISTTYKSLVREAYLVLRKPVKEEFNLQLKDSEGWLYSLKIRVVPPDTSRWSLATGH